MHVYRIEWPDGSGYYRKSICWELMDNVCDRTQHPCPQDDSEFAAQYVALAWNTDPDSAALRWAFESLQSLRRWFYNDNWIKRMSAEGCLVCVYDAYDGSTVVGRTQVAFDSRVAKLVFKEPLVNVLEKV